MFAIVVGNKVNSEGILYSLKDEGYEVQFIDIEKEKEIEDEILKLRGINRANILVALTISDELNLYLCKLGKKVYGVRKTIAVANLPDNIEFLEEQEIDLVLCPSLFLKTSMDNYLKKGEALCI